MSRLGAGTVKARIGSAGTNVIQKREAYTRLCQLRLCVHTTTGTGDLRHGLAVPGLQAEAGCQAGVFAEANLRIG